MIEACPTCLGYVFLEIQAPAENTTSIFLTDADEFIFLSLKSDPHKNKLCLAMIKLQLTHC